VIKKFAIALVAVVLIALAVGLALPREWKVERQVLIHGPAGRIHPLLIDLRRWQDWSVWTHAMDPALRNTYEGPRDGVGAKWLWLGPKMGRGRIEIAAFDPGRLDLDEAIESDVVNAHASITFTAEGEETRVTWRDEGTLPPVVGGFFRSTVEAGLNENFSASLLKLKSIVEALPVTVARDAGLDASDAGSL
jgi:hypothetical protein